MSTTARPDGKAYVNPLANDQRKLKASLASVPDPADPAPTQENEQEALTREIAGLQAFQTLLYTNKRVSYEWRYKIPRTIYLEKAVADKLRNHNLNNVEVLASKFEDEDAVLICVRQNEDRALEHKFKSINDRVKEPRGVKKAF